MGSPQADNLNTDSGGVVTSSNYANAGDGVSRWFQWVRIADGGYASIGDTADSAQTNPTATATVVSVLKGILTRLGGGLPGTLTGAGGLRTGLVDPIPSGSNAIGTVGVTSIPAIPSGGNIIGVTRNLASKSGVISVKTAGVISADGASADIDTSVYNRGVMGINVTAVTGATFDLYWQVKMGSTYYDVVKLNDSGITATGQYGYIMDFPLGSTGRLRWDLTAGTSWNMTADMVMES